MKSLWIAVLLLAPAFAAQDAPLPLERSGDTVVLRARPGSDVRLLDFLEASQPILGVPIDYGVSAETYPRIRLVGDASVHVREFRALFENVLALNGLVVAEVPVGSGILLRVIPLVPGGGRGVPVVGQIPAKVVSVDELESYRDRQLLVTVSVPLEHVEARAAMAALASYFDNVLETVRSVEGSNRVLISAPGAKAWQAFRMLRDMDTPAPGTLPGGSAHDELERLKTRVELLEARLESLELQVTGGR